MDTQHDIALTRALAEVPGPLPPSGVIHVAIPHTSRFTIVGNHLAQHAELSLTAIGIGIHIQSLPARSKVGIKVLAARFPEGETTIAAALRELEAHGYLRRTRVRLAKGRVVARTVFCNQPGAVGRGGAVVGPAVRSIGPAPTLVREHIRVPEPEPTAVPELTPVPEPTSVPEPTPVPEPTAVPKAVPVPEPRPVPEAPHAPVRLPARTAPKQPRRPLPHPRALTPELRQAASALLADLRRHTEELVLSEQDVEELVPGVAAWLERAATTDAIRRALDRRSPEAAEAPGEASQAPPDSPPAAPAPRHPRPGATAPCAGHPVPDLRRLRTGLPLPPPGPLPRLPGPVRGGGLT